MAEIGDQHVRYFGRTVTFERLKNGDHAAEILIFERAHPVDCLIRPVNAKEYRLG